MTSTSVASVPATYNWTRAAIATLLAAGFVIRLLPFVDIDRYLFWFFMTEDGYLMQTVARNMAIGNGMTTADGTIATNGVQPLATFIFAALHALAGGSKLLAVAYVSALSALVAGLAAWLLARMSRAVLQVHPAAGEIALLVAALWFASPLVIGHSTNGLETGIYYLAIVASLAYYFSLDLEGAAGLRIPQQLVLGALLGVTFLARNDAVFFIAAVLLAHLFLGGATAGGGWRRRAIDTMVVGSTSILIASPWLIHNRINFGSIVPISGAAQSYFAGFGQNLPHIPASLLEAVTLYVPVPRSLETSWPALLAALLVIAAFVVGAWSNVGRRDLRGARFFALTMIFAVAVSGYYGLFFGAAHFISRYLSALTPLFALLAVATLWLLLAERLRSPRALPAFVAVAIAGALVITAGRAALHLREEPNNGHRQVVTWVSENVDVRQWVGAVQTGTLGYFHDRTINLDGKVNPYALREAVETGDVRAYVLRKTPINYVVDWASIAKWAAPGDDSGFYREFEVVVEDAASNLGVLRRTSPVPVPAQ